VIVFKCGIVLGGIAAAAVLGTFAAGPALASTGTPHRIPVVISEAAPADVTQPDSAPGGLPLGQPVSGLLSALAQPSTQTGIVPSIAGAADSLLTALGLPDVGTLIGGTPATQNPSGQPGSLGGLLAGLNGSNGLSGLSKLLNGQNGQPDLGKLIGLLVIGKVLGGPGGSNPLGNLVGGQNGLPDLGKLLSGANGQNGLSGLGNLLSGQNASNPLGNLLNGQNGSNPLSGLLNGSNGLGALSALGNLINGAKPAIGG
jgi:hypothetical protein